MQSNPYWGKKWNYFRKQTQQLVNNPKYISKATPEWL